MIVPSISEGEQSYPIQPDHDEKKNITHRVIWLYYKKCESEALCPSFASSIVYEQK